MKKASFVFRFAGPLALLTALSALPAARAADSTSAAPASLPLAFDNTPLDRSNRGQVTSYADMLDQVVPAVVSVYTTINIPTGSSERDQLRQLRQRLYGQTPGPSGSANNPPSGRTLPVGVGSGSIITADGYILTNHHVIVGPSNQPVDGIHVQLQDGREFNARLVGSDEKTDIALLKIEAHGLPTIKLADSDKLKVGDVVFAVGNPMDVGFTVTHGIVSATGRSDLGLLRDEQSSRDGFSLENFIQTDAAINEGNSGGPLVDAQGRQIGMDAAILSESGGSMGIGFAIPSSLLREIVNSLVQYGTVRRGFMGVGRQDLDYDMAQALGLASTHGALINHVEPGLPAETAGIRRGDVVIRVNDQEVDSANKFSFLVANNQPGTIVSLTVLRQGQEPQVIKVRLGDRDALDGNPAVVPSGRSVTLPNVASPVSGGLLDGLTLAPLTSGLRRKYNLANDLAGLVVTNVDRTSRYADQFSPGMVVLEVNKHAVGTPEDVRALLKPGAVNSFYVFNNDQGIYQFIPVPLPAAAQ